MNTQDAIELLGIVPEDDEREIKRKYHKMISRFHPDSLNEVREAHIQRAQEINEAYRILSQSDSREMQNAYGTEAYGTEADPETAGIYPADLDDTGEGPEE